MAIAGCRQLECALETDVDGGGGRQIAAAHDPRDALVAVVDHHGKLVGNLPGPAAQDRVSHGLEGTLGQVETPLVPRRDGAVRELEAERVGAGAPAAGG